MHGYGPDVVRNRNVGSGLELSPLWLWKAKGVTAEPTVFNSKSGELPYVKQAEEHLSRLELLPNENAPLDVACFTTKRQSRLDRLARLRLTIWQESSSARLSESEVSRGGAPAPEEISGEAEQEKGDGDGQIAELDGVLEGEKDGVGDQRTGGEHEYERGPGVAGDLPCAARRSGKIAAAPRP
jgi:hypothetical protein